MKKNLLITWLLFMLLLSVSGCSSAPKEKAPNNPSPHKTEAIKVDVGVLKGNTAIALVKMMQDQPNLGEGVTVKYAMEQSADVLTSKLLTGEMEFATIPTNLAAKLYNQGVPYQLAAMNVWGVMYVLGNGVEIGGWNDLKGKQIGSTSKGTSADIIFKYLLSQNGLNPDEDVTITYTPSPAEQAQLMIAGRSSVAVLPEPWVSTVLARNKDVKVALDLQQEWTRVNGPDVPFAQTCLVVNRNFAAQHPQIVTEFLKKAAESIDWVNNNNRQAAELIKQQNIGIAPEAAQTAIPRCNLCYMSSLDSRPAVEKYLQVLLAYAPQSVGGKLPDDKFYYKE